MKALNAVQISAFLFAAIAFGVAFNLALHNSDLVSMTLGDEALTPLNFVISRISILLQPWVLLGLSLNLHTGWVSSALTGLGSAILMICMFWFFVRNRPRLLWSVVALWSVLAALHLGDLKHTTAIIAEAEAVSPLAP